MMTQNGQWQGVLVRERRSGGQVKAFAANLRCISVDKFGICLSFKAAAVDQNQFVNSDRRPVKYNQNNVLHKLST